MADFGLGKIGGGAGRTTMQAGTPAFQPPEQLKGEMVGSGSDIYALACLVVELFSEKQVWEGLSTHTIILKVAEYVAMRFVTAVNCVPDSIHVSWMCVYRACARISLLGV